jgi:hypothetical protein
MAQRQFQRPGALSILALGVMIGCGGDASINGQPQASPNGTAAIPGSGTEGNAPSLLVPMSMVIPKKMPPATTTTTPTQTAPQIPAGTGFPQAGATPATPGAGAPTTPTMGTPMIPAATPGAGAAGAPAPTTPSTGAAGSAASTGAAPGDSVSGVPAEELAMLRQTCVDEINMYRATLMLEPMKRATPEQELCSDNGAKTDGDSGRAHGSAGSCRGLGSQNTCPGYMVGGRSGNATLADTLKGCLKQMWAEGEPPKPRAECERDYQNCFLAHGHYLNMSDTRNKTVSCGFYKMQSGAYWMNQDFGF